MSTRVSPSSVPSPMCTPSPEPVSLAPAREPKPLESANACTLPFTSLRARTASAPPACKVPLMVVVDLKSTSVRA